MYQNVLLDLDGTLTEPGLGITNSVMYSLMKFGIEVEDRTSLYKFIGPPLADSFKMFYGFSDEESRQAVSYYREYFQDKGLYENEVYDGIEELLMELRKRNKKIILATSKPEVFAKEILRHFGLLKYFDFVAGATLDGSRDEKAAVIRYALDNCHIDDLSSAIMVGDRKHDIIGAKKNGIESIGVLYGYGDLQELKENGATYIAENVDDILELIK